MYNTDTAVGEVHLGTRRIYFRADVVQRRAGAEPFELVTRQSVSGRNVEGLTVALGHPNGDLRVVVAVEEISQAVGLDHVTRSNTGVVRLVDEPKRENALFLSQF